MKKYVIGCLACLLSLLTFSQQGYWQQEVHYAIHVALNDQNHTLKGKMSLEYINHSPDTLSFIWFHLWPNAYKNNNTALAKQLAEDKTRKKIKDKEIGFIDSLDFTVNGQAASVQPDLLNIDVVKLFLPQPVLPEQKIMINTPFYVKLPFYFSRSGWDGQQYMICQWYPKPAVYDHKGWHPMPYLDQGEFFSEYGTFDVTISLPSEYVVAASGVLQTIDELEKYRAIGAANYSNKDISKRQNYIPDKPGAIKTLAYHAENVHDFAWFADKDFIIQYDTLQLPSGKIVDAFAFYQPNGNQEWRNSIGFIESTVRKYSEWVGEYPYPTAQAVEGPKNQSSGGMEYPMITLITSPDANKEYLDGVIAHEVGHNWFYGALGNNERDHPWMDEGINTFFQFRYEAEKYRSNGAFGKALPDEFKILPVREFQSRVYQALNNLPASQSITAPSTAFTNKEEYGIVVYAKAAVWMFIVEASIGRENLQKAMRAYFDEWKFKHPYPEDLKRSWEKAVGLSMDELFDLLNKEGNFQ